MASVISPKRSLTSCLKMAAMATNSRIVAADVKKTGGLVRSPSRSSIALISAIEAYSASRAAPRSAIKSSVSSIPTE
jgi:hypothetical protein